jgi:hypothetical protein
MKNLFIKNILPAAAIAFLSIACEDPERGENKPLTAPALRFDSVGAVKTGSFTVYGNITSSGGLLVQGRGVLYSETSETPGFKDLIKAATGDGIGIMTAALNGLKPRTTYRFRLFARNWMDTTYSDVFTYFSAPTTPALSAAVIIDSTRRDSIVVESQLTSNGGETIFDRGFVISRVNNPAINTKPGEINFVAIDSDSSLNTFRAVVRNFVPQTRYFIRPYARNRGGIGYGTTVSILSKP